MRLALTLLNDNHSFIQTQKSKYIFDNNPSNYVRIDDKMGIVPDDVGYIKVGGNFGSSTDVSVLAKNIQDDIKNADRENLKGWIVDLRGNDGGNMWPMLAGLGPILGEGILGYFIDVDKSEISWSYNKGKSQVGNQMVVSVLNPYTLKKDNPKVAVLINQSIASSGEATTIAFKGRPNTKFFGTPTFGLSTANRSFTLSDKALLYLTVSTMADRNKKLYGSKVEPDVLTTMAASTNNAAIEWVRE